ncbi:MAG: ribosomal protein S18 acetylase RimI-like enzyme [Alteromonadaceae bacterium]|jgi:ribosomal protein S18 acetylase RimI-like enzyme
MNISVLLADYYDEKHAKDLVFLLNEYAEDPMGGGESLSDFVKINLIDQLKQQTHVFTVLCYVDNKPAGLINCVEGFSTFSAKPLVNIHDVCVSKSFRGKGLSKLMFAKVEEISNKKGCCKLTLEVLEGNKIAQSAYQSIGFSGYELDPEMGKAIFWQKKL